MRRMTTEAYPSVGAIYRSYFVHVYALALTKTLAKTPKTVTKTSLAFSTKLTGHRLN